MLPFFWWQKYTASPLGVGTNTTAPEDQQDLENSRGLLVTRGMLIFIL